MIIHEKIIDESKKLFNVFFSKQTVKVNIFCTGSIARNEEIYNKDSLISDVDYIFVFKNKIKKNIQKKIKEQLISIWRKNEYLSDYKYSFIFISEKQFTKNRLSELYLSSDLKKPLFSNYYFDEKMLRQRICFASQPIGYYYSKFKIFNDNRYLIKSIFCQLKVLLYINHCYEPSHYISNGELLNSKDFIEQIVPGISIDNIFEYYNNCFKYKNYCDLQIIFDRVRNVLIKSIYFKNNLNSVKIFNLTYCIAKQNTIFSKCLSKLVINLVNKENLS